MREPELQMQQKSAAQHTFCLQLAKAEPGQLHMCDTNLVHRPNQQGGPALKAKYPSGEGLETQQGLAPASLYESAKLQQ